jgi:hypothetical protein
MDGLRRAQTVASGSRVPPRLSGPKRSVSFDWPEEWGWVLVLDAR